MHHEGQESSFRKLVWVEGQSGNGWGCSECAWVFDPSPPVGKSLDEQLRTVEAQRTEEFAAHDCPEYPRTP
jgi:hypothetical protein